MSKSNQDKLNDIKVALTQGHFLFAEKELAKLTKRGRPSAKQRVQISEYWSWLGREDRSWRILGAPLPPQEYPFLHLDELMLQLRLAFNLSM